jgi:bacillopeptidase F
MSEILILLVSSVLISPELKVQLENLQDNEKITAIIVMKAEYPFEALENLPIKQKAQIFKEIANNSQRDLINYLNQLPDEVTKIEKFWVFNGLHITASKRIMTELFKREDIKYMLHNGAVRLPESGRLSDIRAIEWNIRKIQADSCWNTGYTGQDILIGITDTGCDFTHPALQGKWSGYWRDCVNGQAQPYDDNGHGVFAAGIICGGDGLGPFTDDIGTAPGARLVVAKVFDQNGGSQYVWIDAGMQWIADLKVDSGVDIRAVSNSWGGGTYDLHFWDMCLTWKSIGILGIWSIGSGGPGQGTCGAPGNYPLVLGCGATDSKDVIASFSSRGPAPNQPPWNDTLYWFRRDWNLTKPDVAAPGVGIRSSYNNGSYAIMNGTSWTNPHAAGGVAIMCQAKPNLTVTQLYNLFLDNADTVPGGYTWPNNTYGWGRINLWRSLQSALHIEENNTKELSEITIIPNPCKGILEISLGDYNGLLNIYDVTGRTIFTTLYKNKSRILNLPETLNNGIYFLKIPTPNRVYVKKIVLIKN